MIAAVVDDVATHVNNVAMVVEVGEFTTNYGVAYVDNITCRTSTSDDADDDDEYWRRHDAILVHMRVLCQVWLTLPIAAAGIVGNLLSFVVLCRYPLMTTTVVLRTLAVADIAVLVSNVLLSMRYLHIPGYTPFPYAAIFRWLYPTIYNFRLAGGWLNVLLTVDRYIAVCRPLHAHRLCTVRRTAAIIGAILAVVVVFNVPRYFEYEVVDVKVNEFGFRATFILNSTAYNVVYRIALFFVAAYLLPVSVIAALNVRLLATLRRTRNLDVTTLGCHHMSTPTGGTARMNTTSDSGVCDQRSVLLTSTGATGRTNTTSGSKMYNQRGVALTTIGASGRASTTTFATRMPDQRAATLTAATRTVTVIAVAVVTVSVICDVISMVTHAIWSATFCLPDWRRLEYLRRYLANVSNVLVTFSSAVNVFVYSVVSRQFRRTLAALLRCRRLPQSGPGASHVIASRAVI